MITTISYKQEEIIQNIINLYVPEGFDLDPTYSKGVFYKNLPKPRICMDLHPQVPGVVEADARSLPLPSSSIKSIMFDPPFIAGGQTNGKDGIIKNRFGYYKRIPELWKMYEEAIKEFKRVLEPNGILVFKCQDTVEDHKQYFSEYKIMSLALDAGFYPKDKFILLAKNRLVSPSQRIQQHARKFHSYFLVFINKKPLVQYM